MATVRADRRLTTIMAVDIVGYSRLIQTDEAATLAAIKALRSAVIDPLVAEYTGRIVKLMGDGALIEFGSVVDAVTCAIAVQKSLSARQADVPPDRRIVFRIGVNLGDVVVEGERCRKSRSRMQLIAKGFERLDPNTFALYVAWTSARRTSLG
jgi:adenylate cyclase